MSARCCVCVVCGALAPGGLCGSCGTIRDLEGAAACAACSTLARNRLEWLSLQLDEAISTSKNNLVVLDRDLAITMYRHLLDAEFEAEERIEAECDLAASAGRRA